MLISKKSAMHFICGNKFYGDKYIIINLRFVKELINSLTV